MNRPDDYIGNMQVVGDAFRSSVLNGAEALSEKSGKGMTAISFGIDSLHRRARHLGVPEAGIQAITDRTMQQYCKGENLCESPIERTMLGALLTASWSHFESLPAIVHSAADKSENLPAGDVVIIPQMAFLRFRMDFGVVLRSRGNWKTICVECDGEEFHQDADKERGRIAYLKSWNIPTFKFTGARIYAEATECASEVSDFACQWWCAING